MKKNPLIFLLLLSVGLMMLPIRIFACACCAEPGMYFLRTQKPSSYELGLIKDFDFDRKANLYLTEADFDIIKGLDDIRDESSTQQSIDSGGAFDLVSSFTGKLWRFEIRSTGGKKGVLTLPITAQMVTFKVDIHDEEDRPNGPMLYKEFRFKGSISGGTGIFRSSMVRPTTYFLVFQGRGNGCDNAEDFTHWRLEISGPKAEYAFYGKLGSGTLNSDAGPKISQVVK
jgi:hypothetical protein